MLHPDLDALIARIRSLGMIAGLITNGYLLSPKRIEALNNAGLDYLQISIDNVEPDEISKKSLRLLDKKLQWLADHAHFDININSVVGGGIKNPDDARTINRRARELGFSTSIGIIHDTAGLLKPLGAAERAIFDEVSELIDSRRQVVKNLYSGIRSFQMNLADGKPNEWQCRAGARYLYICENGLVHWCSQQRGTPGVPLATLHHRRHPPRVSDAEMVRTDVHDRLRAPGVDDGLLAQAAEVGPRRCGRPGQPAFVAVGRVSMATPPSFDITSGVDLQEVDNAVNQARKEVAQRYDFKGSRAAIDLNRTENTIVLTADDEFKMNALWEILQGRLVRRGVPTKNLTPGRHRAGRQRHGPAHRDAAAGHPDRSCARDRQVPEGPQAEKSPGRHSGRSGPRVFRLEG